MAALGISDHGYCTGCGSPVEGRDDGPPRCPACGRVQWKDPKVAAGILIARGGEILLVQRNHEPGFGRWSFPSGYVDRGEVVEDAAVREAREEAGVDVVITGLLGVLSEPGNPVVFIAYEGSTEGEPSPGPEAIAVGYFLPSSLPPLAFDHDHLIIEAWRERNASAST